MFSFACFILEVDKASSLIRSKHNREFVRWLGCVGRILSFHAQCKAIFLQQEFLLTHLSSIISTISMGSVKSSTSGQVSLRLPVTPSIFGANQG